jgi:hypothetical protein
VPQVEPAAPAYRKEGGCSLGMAVLLFLLGVVGIVVAGLIYAFMQGH